MDAEMQTILYRLKTKFEKTASELATLKLKKVCPFYETFGNKIVCPYKEHAWNTCFDVNVAPGNSDAWCTIMIERCTKMIERDIIDTGLHYNDNHDDDEWENDE